MTRAPAFGHPPPERSAAPDSSRRRVGVAFLLVLGLELLLYVGFASRLIQARIGYQYDEALFVDSAVFMLHGVGVPPTRDYDRWVAAHGRRWPLMVLPYAGTAKAVVALPVFALFGIGTETARYPGVVLGCAGIAGLVTLIGLHVSPVAGLLVGALLAIHPSYLDLTVFDNSGVSVWMAVMGLGALALSKHLHRPSRISAFLLGAVAGLGAWARLNVLWLVASALVAALLVFGRRAVPPWDQIAAAAIGSCVGALPLILYEAGSGIATLRFIAETRQPLSLGRLGLRLRETAELMISDDEQRRIWAGPLLSAWQAALGAVLLAALPACLAVRLWSEDPWLSRWRRAFAWSAIVLSGIMLTSGLQVAPHHLVAVLPLTLAALAILLVELGFRARPAIPWIAAGATALAVVLISWDVRIDRGLRRSGGVGIWSTAVEDVGRYLKSHPVPLDRLKILNWGFLNNLYVASGGSVYGTELFWGATRTHSSRGLGWESEIRDGGAFLLYLFPTGSPSIDAAAEGFSKALEDYRGPYRERRFFDRSGSPVARLVEIPAAR